MKRLNSKEQAEYFFFMENWVEFEVIKIKPIKPPEGFEVIKVHKDMKKL